MQSGDFDAFEEFFNAYKRPVYATALAITRDPFLAEEILQDCFVKAYRVRHRLRLDVSPLPWLQRVTTNLCYSRIARRRAIEVSHPPKACGSRSVASRAHAARKTSCTRSSTSTRPTRASTTPWMTRAYRS